VINILIGGECTGTIRDAFRARRFNAWSCDLLPDVKGSPYHYQCDILQLLASTAAYWQLFIVHPDCTYLTGSAEWCYRGVQTKNCRPGVLYGAERRAARVVALDFVRALLAYEDVIPHMALENPVGKIGTEIRPATQYIQPYEYGHDASKKTGLWLHNLPVLVGTNYIAPRMVGKLPRWGNQTDSGQNRLGPSADRWLLRATTYDGWAQAMAKQWGDYLRSTIL
jgi:hypothetical protein